MIKVLLVFFLSLYTIGGYAQQASLVIINKKEASFKLYMDNKLVAFDAPEHIRLSDLDSKSYDITIKFDSAGITPVSSSVFLPEGNESTYELKQVGEQQYSLSLLSRVKITDHADDEFEASIVEDPDSNLTMEVDSAVIAGYSGPRGCKNPMDDGTFKTLKEQVEGKIFEEQKLNEAKSIVKNKCFFTKQIKSFLVLLEFDDNKLDLAKYAYGYTFDQANFLSLLDVFYFKASKNELKGFVR